MRPGPLLLVLAVGGGVLVGCSNGPDGARPIGSREEFCAELRTALEQHLTVFDPLDPVSPDETSDELNRLADAAPADLQNDVSLLADAFTQVAEVLSDVAPDDPEATERLDDLALDQDAIAEAQQEVADYAADTCGINLAAINDASVPTTTAPPATIPPATTVPATTVPPTTTAG